MIYLKNKKYKEISFKEALDGILIKDFGFLQD